MNEHRARQKRASVVRIAHTADIHWRGLSRHGEFREVFTAMARDCKEQGVDHIAVEGDIFHTKTQGITPEYIEQLSWWLNELADAVPHSGAPTVHIRLGNHDGNLMNSTRQDAVTPVVDVMGDSRIRLYKRSGVYAFAPGFNWCVFGIFDEAGWGGVKPVPGEVNIACFHGPVAGARSETDWEIEGDLSVSFFEAFDFAFLGDIHKTQHLARRGPGQLPWISYPGTPVQQNYAEARERCYLLWDIRSRDDFTVEERQLPNPRPFVNIKWCGSIEATLKQEIGIPRGSRCRIVGDDKVGQSEMAALNAAIVAACAPSEVTFKFDRPVGSTVTLPGTDEGGFRTADLRNPDVLVRMLKGHHKDASVTDAEWSEVTRLITSYLTTIGATEEVARNVRWSPRRLKFDNMFAYGSANSINFDSLQGVTGIFGPNRSGKSSIVGTLMYSLFNTTDRGLIENMHVVNVRHPHCYSSFVVHVAGVDYVVERQTIKHESRRGSVSGVTALNVYRLDESGELMDLCGEQRRDTEKVVRSLIGTAADFQLTSLAAQGDVDRFIREGSTQRHHILARFLDIDIFERMHECAKDDSKSLRDHLRRTPVVDLVADETRLLGLLAVCDRELLSISEEHAATAAELEVVTARLAGHLGFVPVTQAQISTQERRRDEASRALEVTKSREAAAAAELATAREAADRLHIVRQKHDIIALRARLEQARELERRVDALRHARQTAVADRDRVGRSLRTLDGVPCGDSFPGCRFIKDAHADKGRIADLEAAVGRATTELVDAETSLAAIVAEKITERVGKHDQAVALLARTAADVARLQAELAGLAERTPSQEEALAREDALLATLRDAQGRNENAEVMSLRGHEQRIRSHLRELDSMRIAQATARGRYEVELEKCRTVAAERAAAESQLKVYDLISSAFSKRGIPAAIVAAELPVINAEIAKILYGIVDFTVELAVQDEGSAMDVYINYGDSRRLLELGSGMEKFVSCIAIRVALTTVSSLPKTDVFIIDEGFGSLDDAGIEACGRLLQSLKRYFRNVIVISHVDGIKDVADNVLEITRVEKDSMVVVP